MAKLSTRRTPKAKPHGPINSKATTALPRKLPGMEDKASRVLEEIAFAYADIRDRRVALLNEEVMLKARALAELRRLGRTGYHRNGVDMSIIPGAETLKVKVSPPTSADQGDAHEPAVL